MNAETAVPDNATLARRHMGQGGHMEGLENWQAAADAYRLARSANSPDPLVRYFASNNLGYVLLQMERYEEAAECCREAISINPEQYNAHKNLGLAFQGQGLWIDAAWCLLEATRLCPGDARAWQLLNHLLAARPGLLDQDGELRLSYTTLREVLAKEGYLQAPVPKSPVFRPPMILPLQ
ncbi:MAG: tetratricopeptide repeat protein [Pseudomonadota bacterium]